MMAANLQSVQTLCHGCLSADRDLSPIGEFSDMFTMICDRKARVPGLKYTHLCWECTATLKRMQSFHKQVNNAQTILKCYVRRKNLQKPVPKSLSRLETTSTNHDFISLIEPDEPEVDIKPLDEIKEEDDHDYEENYSEQELIHDEDGDFENTDMFDADNDFIYLDDIKSENPTLVKKQINLKTDNNKKSATTDNSDSDTDANEKDDLKEDPTFIVALKDLKEKPRQQTEKRYCRINTAEEMCVKEQARQSDLVNLWGRDGCIVQGPGMSHETVYRCLVCGHRSPSVEAAGRHVAIHKNVVKCQLCEFCCRQLGVARSHYKIAHSKFLCDYCGKKCLTKLLIQQHISRHHTENKCKLCPRTFPDYKRLTFHMSAVHDEADPSGETFCVRCNKQYKNRRRLDHHLRYSAAHADEYGKVQERIKCLECDKSFSKRCMMMDHYHFVHLGTRRRYCGICDRNFGTARDYGYHIRYKHEGREKPRDKICGVCGRGFSQNFILINHMRTHTGERPYACAVCDARFAQKVARDLHQKRHYKAD